MSYSVRQTSRRPNTESNPRPVKYPIATARSVMADHFAAIARDTLEFHRMAKQDRAEPRQYGLKITTGAGKSHHARTMVVDYVQAARSEGLPHRVLFLVPTHKLAEEARKRMELLGVKTAIWQSRKAKNVETDEPLCRNPDAVKAAEDISVPVETAACRQPRKGQEPVLCPFFETCGYQKQKISAEAADVVFAAHEIGFYGIPKPIGDGFGLVVIDPVVSGERHEAAQKTARHEHLNGFYFFGFVFDFFRLTTDIFLGW